MDGSVTNLTNRRPLWEGRGFDTSGPMYRFIRTLAWYRWWLNVTSHDLQGACRLRWGFPWLLHGGLAAAACCHHATAAPAATMQPPLCPAHLRINCPHTHPPHPGQSTTSTARRMPSATAPSCSRC